MTTDIKGEITLLSLPLVILCVTFTSCTDNRPLDEQLHSVLETGIGKYSIKGVSAAVICTRQKTWSGTAGISHENVPVAPEMVSAIGSITKNCVSALTLKLAEEELLSLEEPVSK
jgi:CubicO group peptidase (beta-lactamase class C family)